MLACLLVTIVAIGASGISVLPWASNAGCQDLQGTRDADVSVQVVPFGLVCSYEADSTGPAEVVVRAASLPAFGAWLAFIGAVVAYGMTRRERPAARGLVTGVVILGVFGFLSTTEEFIGALGMTAICGTVVVAVLDAWLWPSRLSSIIATALLVPFAVVTAWFVPGLGGWGEIAAVLALAAAAGATVVGTQAEDFLRPRPFKPVT